MTQMTTPKQLFEHELKDMYYAEKTIEKMLPKLVSEATTRDLSRAFEAHLIETREQIKNLERSSASSERARRARRARDRGHQGRARQVHPGRAPAGRHS